MTSGRGLFSSVSDRAGSLLERLNLGGPRDLTTITIEHGYIKLMISRGLEVIDYLIAVANPEYFREGLVSDAPRIADILRSATGEMNASHRRVVAAVPGYQTTLGRLELPVTGQVDPKLIIPREASKKMGLSTSTSFLTWHRLPDNIDRSRWLIVAAARRSMNSLTATAETAGLSLTTMELRPFALARAVNQSDAVIAWTSADGCEVTIVREWVPVLQQSAYWGAEPVEGSVLVNRLTDIIDRTISAHDVDTREAPLPISAPLYVTGSPVGLERDVAAQVADNLRRPIGEIEPPLEVPADFPIDDLVVNVGLALWQA